METRKAFLLKALDMPLVQNEPLFEVEGVYSNTFNLYYAHMLLPHLTPKHKRQFVTSLSTFPLADKLAFC